jgi:hypothetical protein
MGKFSVGNKEITKPKLVLVEGDDEAHFLPTLVKKLGIESVVAVASYDGLPKLQRALENLGKTPGYMKLEAMGVMRDADENSDDAFKSVCDRLEQKGFARPTAPARPCGERPRVSVLIVPPGKPRGNLEDLCLESMADDPAMPCVNEFFQCLAERLDNLPDKDSAKAHLKAFLISRELLEESHFRFIQEHLETWIPAMPEPPSVEKVHAFLASRYNPTLALGVAAEKGYWNLDHPAFDPLKAFLQSL